MKKTLLILPVFLLLFNSCRGQIKEKNSSTELTISDSINKIKILEFYGKHRCDACINIEKNTKFTLNNHFTKELESGKISYNLINFDLKKNEDIVEKYGAYGTSLYIITIIEDKENVIDLSTFALLNYTDKTKFAKKLKEKITKQLNLL